MLTAGSEEPKTALIRSESSAVRTLVLLSAAYVVAMIDRTVLVPLIGYVQHDLSITDTQFGLLQGLAFSLFYVIASIPLGYWIDRTSRILVISAGLTLWSVATVTSAFAGSFGVLFTSRTAVAVGEATLNPAAFSLLADIFPKEKLGRVIAIFQMGASVGTGLAFIIASVLVSIFHNQTFVAVPLIGTLKIWQVAFLVAGVPGIVLALAIVRLREPLRRSLNSNNAALASSWWHFFKKRHVSLALIYLATSCQLLLLYAFMTWAPAMLLRDHHMAPAHVGLVMGLSASLFGIVGFYAGGSLADRWWKAGRRDAHLRVGLWAHCAMLPLGVMAALTHQTALAVVAVCLVNALQVGTGPSTIAGLQLMTPGPLRGRTSSIMMAVATLIGVTLGPLSVALLNDHVFKTIGHVGYSLATVCVIVCPIAIILFGLGKSRVAHAISLLGD